MEFACDVKLAPGKPTLVAGRRHAGTAFAWNPGDDPGALVDFVGEQFVAIGADVYRRESNGTLTPMDLSQPVIFLRPVAGDALVPLGVDEFAQSWAVVQAKPVKAKDEPPKTEPAKAAGAAKKPA